MQIQCSIMGFSVKPTSVYSVYNEDTGILVVSAEKGWRTSRFKDCALISDASLDERDFVFSQGKVSDAINAYYDMLSLGSLSILDSASRCNPESGIEYDGLKEGGKVFRLSPSINNSQVAVIASCLFVKTNRVVDEVFDMIDDLSCLMDGGIVTF